MTMNQTIEDLRKQLEAATAAQERAEETARVAEKALADKEVEEGKRESVDRLVPSSNPRGDSSSSLSRSFKLRDISSLRSCQIQRP